MANPALRVSENVPGDVFVDSTCIDCDACRQIAPQVFGETGHSSYVHTQPYTAADRRQAWRALLSCPTGSIGDLGPVSPKAAASDFPLLVEDPVYYCGYTSPRSYGGNSYLVRHPEGNWLVDSPKFLPPLVRQIESLGGVKYVFLTHRDDVADADRFARHFRATRIVHREELDSQPDAEWVLEGTDPVELVPGFRAIPTPGHTKGHCVLHVADRFLFTGDHLAWDRHEGMLEAFRDYCWYSWPELLRSMRRLLEYRFEWVLPGHGQRVHLPEDQMRSHLERLIAAG